VIRLATNGDVPQIVALGSLSLKGGPYEKLIADNPEHTYKLALQVIHGGGKILVEEEGGKINGLLAFLIVPHPFSGELTATELMWYVLPEARAGGSGLKLLWEAERIAKEAGCKKFQFAAPTDEIGALYKRFGYFQIEVNYLKELS
jgi:GNAT superfamily N-acetyltransferase